MPETNWYTWPTQTDFDAWHHPVVEALNLPRISNNAATGQPEPEAQQTVAYTATTKVAADDLRAPVEPHIASDFAAGLGTPCDPPPTPPDDF